MGILTSMRKRGGLLATVIGFAILAFLVGDVLVTGQSIFNASQTEVGVVDGQSIDFKEFDQKLQVNIENFKQQQGQANIDDNIQGYLVDQTWNQMIQEIVMKNQEEALGLKVTPEELFDMIQGKNPDPEIQRAFVNQQGIFDRNLVINFLQTMDQRDPSGKTRAQWVAFERSLKENRLRQKYFAMVKGGLYVTTAMAKADYKDKSKSTDFTYVSLNYFSVPDSAVKFTEDDVNAYYKKNAYKFQQKESTRSFEYLFSEVIPSAKDSSVVFNWITEKADYLKANTDDSLYISLNADTKFVGSYAKKGTLGSILDSNLFNAAVGTVYGPYMENGSYKVAKLLKVKTLPDSVKARHILITPENGNVAAAQKSADSLKALIKGGADFAALAMTNSKDQGSAVKGGDLGYFAQGTMVQPFNDACFYGNKGDLVTVTSQFGVHLIQIMDQKNFNRNVMVGVIDRRIDAGNETNQEAYAKINAVRAEVSNAEEFDAVKPSGFISKRVSADLKANDKFVSGLDNPKELLRWVFKANKGEISPVFEIGNKFVFAKLTAVKDKGTIALEYVKDAVEAEVKKEKKKEMLLEKINKAAEGASSIAQVAQKLNVLVDTAVGTNFATGMIPGVAREPQIVAIASVMEKGKMSKAIAGASGVYLIQVNNVIEPPAPSDFTLNKMQLEYGIKGQLENKALEALKDNAGIKDSRSKFY